MGERVRRRVRELVEGERFTLRLGEGERVRTFAGLVDGHMHVYADRRRGPDAPTRVFPLYPEAYVWVESEGPSVAPEPRERGRKTTPGGLPWPHDQWGRDLVKGSPVRLHDAYDEHVDNVGVERRGTVVEVGEGDWEGFARVQFVGVGRPHWVPSMVLTATAGDREVAVRVLVSVLGMGPAVREVLGLLGVTDEEIDKASRA